MIDLRVFIKEFKEVTSHADEETLLILQIDTKITNNLRKRIKELVEEGFFTEITIKESEDIV